MKGDDLRIRRKAQKLGSSTLAVTVPAEWARRHDLTKGDELVVQRDENGNSLLITPDRPALEDTETVIDADSMGAEALSRAVVSQYVLGRGLVRIEAAEGLDPPHYDAVIEAENRLMGLGIVEESATHITIRCSVDPNDFDLPTLLGRLSRTEATIRSNAVGALQSGDTDAARRAADRSLQLEKLFSLFLRLVFTTYRNPRLNRAVGVGTGFPLIGYRSAAQDVSLMAGIADDIATIAAERVCTSSSNGARDTPAIPSTSRRISPSGRVRTLSPANTTKVFKVTRTDRTDSYSSVGMERHPRNALVCLRVGTI